MNLNTFFNPKSIAVVGASRRREKIGNRILNNIIKSGYYGKTYPVNPEASQVLGLKSYKKILDIAGVVDLVIIVIPREFVLESIGDGIKKGVKNFIIITAGFKEFDERGKLLEEKIKILARENQLNILGPNCLGILSAKPKLNASFADQSKTIEPISIISQSGAIISSMLDWSKTHNIGFEKVISLGNKALINENDFLDFLANDKETKNIVMYLESIDQPAEFYKILSFLTKSKGVFILHGGKSKIGNQASLSHTGALANDNIKVKALMEKSGAVYLENLEELFYSLLEVGLKNYGRKIAIVTNAGGPSIALVDYISKSNLIMAPIDKNPIDLLGHAQAIDYQNAIEDVLKNPKVDSVFVILTPLSNTKIDEITKAIILLSKNSGKNIFVSYIGGEKINKSKKEFLKGKIPFSEFPENLVSVYEKIAQVNNRRIFKKTDRIKITKNIIKKIKNIISSDENQNFKTYQIFETLEFNVIKTKKCDNLPQVIKAVNEIHFPVVLKTAAENIIHKKKENGVYLNLIDFDSLKNAYQKILLLSKQVFVQPMAFSDVELFIGAKCDKNYGTSIVFGSGGSNIEKIKDNSLMLAPLTKYEMDRLINEPKISNVINNEIKEKLKTMILTIQELMDRFENILELDLNPILVDLKTNELIIIDPRIIWK